MKGTMLTKMLVLGLVLIVCRAGLSQAASIGTGFTYQGRLIDANNAADGLYDFQFKLYNANVAGTQKGSTIDVNEMDVIDGYFTVSLDFGSDVFDGNDRWLQIGVRAGELKDPNAYTLLIPRQQVTPTPYALYAKTAGGSLWQVNGPDIYYNAGKVGIGTTTPGAGLGGIVDVTNMLLDVNGQMVVSGNGNGESILFRNSGYFLGDLSATPTFRLVDRDNRRIFEVKGRTDFFFDNVNVYPDDDNVLSLGLSTNRWASFHSVNGYFGGSVGIGTTSPADKLDVAGHINSSESYKLDGYTVLSNSGTENIFAGRDAGAQNTTGYDNSAIGYRALYSNTMGCYNAAIGYGALSNNTGGNYNSAMGVAALNANKTGNSNSAVGFWAFCTNTAGNNNTAVGCNAGYNATGSGNVFLGYQAGQSETGSNKLYIANATGTPLIYGDFSTGRVAIGTTAPGTKLEMRGVSSDDAIRASVDPGPTTGRWIQMQYHPSVGPLIQGAGYQKLTIDAYAGAQGEIILGQGGDYVGIGTASPQYTLDVIGDIRATGSVYYGGTAGNHNGTAYNKPDYVFEEGYDIMSIDEAEEYLKKENHLPWMTSAKQENQENGGAINITRMAFETVETAENLQMQVIELNKIVKEQAALINAQQKRIEALEETAAQSQSLKQRLDILQNAIEQNHVSSAKEVQQ